MRMAIAIQWAKGRSAADLFLGVCLVLLTYAATLYMPGPFTHADEGSYLIGAIGLSGALNLTPVWSYHLGYSLLFTPFAWIFHDPITLYHAALFINSLLIGLIYLVWSRTCSRLFRGLSWFETRLLGLIAAAQPAVLPFSLVAMTEVSLAFALAAAIYFLVSYYRGTGIGSLMLFAAFLGSMYLITPRGEVLALCFLVTSIIWIAQNINLAVRVRILHVILALMTCVTVMAVNHLLDRIASIPVTSGYALPPLDYMFKPRYLLHTLELTSGIVTVSLATSMGAIVILGVAISCREVDTQTSEFRSIAMALLIGLCATIAMAVIFYAYTYRMDLQQMFSRRLYARYVSPVCSAIVPLGFAWAVHRRKVGAFRFALISLPVVVLATIFVSKWFPAWPPKTFNWLNTPLYIFSVFTNQFSALAASSIFLCLAIPLVLFIWRKYIAGLVLLLGTCVLVFAAFFMLYAYPQAHYSNSRRYVTRYAENLIELTHNQACIHLAKSLSPWWKFDLRYYLARNLDFAKRWKKCRANLTIGPLSIAQRYDVVLAEDHRSHLGLYTDAKSLSVLMPYGVTSSGKWPLVAQHVLNEADVHVEGTRYREVTNNATIDLRVKITNMSAYIFNSAPGENGQMRVGVRLVNVKSGYVRDVSRADFGAPLLPGSTSTVKLKMRVHAKSNESQLCIGLVAEHVAWADTNGSAMKCLHVGHSD